MDKNIINKEIGIKIRQVRAIKGWSREQMAEKLELSPSNYGNIERGATDISISRLIEIAEIFDISLPDLLGVNEKTVFNLSKSMVNTECLIGFNHTSNNDVNNNGDVHLKHELEKSVLLLKERDKEIENLKVQISQLQQISSLLRERA